MTRPHSPTGQHQRQYLEDARFRVSEIENVIFQALRAQLVEGGDWIPVSGQLLELCRALRLNIESAEKVIEDNKKKNNDDV